MPKNKPNRLFQVLLGISLVIHVFIFMYVAGFYDSNAFTYIEMTLEDISKPFSRDIPRPRPRPKSLPKPRDIKKLEIRKQMIPQFKPIKMAPVDNVSSGIGENISTDGLLQGSGLDLAGWTPDAMADMKDMLTQKDYFDMVQLRIESQKKYPQAAKNRHLEGRTVVEFTISANGHVSDIKVTRSSRNKTLDEAAMAAVKKAAPFPRPPLNLFKGPIRLEVALLFETM